jgi:hypothetical protein
MTKKLIIVLICNRHEIYILPCQININKEAVFWDVAPYSSCVNRRYGGMYGIHQLLSCPWEGALSDERTGVVCQSVSSIWSIVSMYYFYILHVSHITEYIYNIYKASVSPGSVQQIMSNSW